MTGIPPRPDRREMLLVAAGAAALAATPAEAARAETPQPSSPSGMRASFDTGWCFRRGTLAGGESPTLDDAAWDKVDLPHDWSIADLAPAADGRSVIGPFDRHAEGGTATGFTVGGEGWYRKRFRLDATQHGRVEILFDGVYENSEVWLNGHRLGEHAYGYTPFGYDLTPHLAADGDNLIAVLVRNEGRNSRWYSGSGIYRHVWLECFAETARIARWGVSVATRRILPACADLAITTMLDRLVPGLVLASRIRNAQGKVVWEATAAAMARNDSQVRLRSPRLWSPDDPALYTLETELRRGSVVLDRETTPFGVRVVAFDPVRGMTVNGRTTKLRGGCIHHDNGLLGACAFDAAEDRKVRLLRARGYNAVRPSHNPFSPAFLDACDRHGMLVIAETFDCWRWGKRPQDYSLVFDAEWKADLATIVASARNHPSIVMWSIGNEIPHRNTADGLRLQWELADEVHRLDPTRPVTAAINSFAGRPVIPAAGTARPGSAGRPDSTSTVFLDVVGYNYKLADYAADHARFPSRVFFGTESFPKDVFSIWELTDRSPWLVGDFVWTAMDYLGEAGIGGSTLLPATVKNPMGGLGAWPYVNAFCGDIDLIGQQKPPSRARDVVWGLSLLEVAVQRPVPDGKVEALKIWGWSDEQPSWTWPGSEGRPLKVRVYTAGDRIEILLNGKPVETRTLAPEDRKRVEIPVPYAPGVLEVRAYRGATPIGRRTLTTCGASAAVRVSAERPTGGAGRGDVSYVLAEICDADGHVVPDAKLALSLHMTGPGELAAFGSANPVAVGSFQKADVQSWNGRALAIVRGTGRAGTVSVEIGGEGLRSGTASIRLV